MWIEPSPKPLADRLRGRRRPLLAWEKDFIVCRPAAQISYSILDLVVEVIPVVSVRLLYLMLLGCVLVLLGWHSIGTLHPLKAKGVLCDIKKIFLFVVAPQ